MRFTKLILIITIISTRRPRRKKEIQYVIIKDELDKVYNLWSTK